jgi:hypothetical protein
LELHWASAAVAFGEFDLDHRIAADINARNPELTRFSRGTCGLLMFPVQFEILSRKPVAVLACLPARILSGGAD